LQQAAERQVRELEVKLRRLTDCLLSNLLSDAEYRSAKEELNLQLIAARVRHGSPAAQDADWRRQIEEILVAGRGSLADFRAGSTTVKRSVLATVYANLQVEHGIPKFSLKTPYMTLVDAPIVHAGVPMQYANFPQPSECW